MKILNTLALSLLFLTACTNHEEIELPSNNGEGIQTISAGIVAPGASRVIIGDYDAVNGNYPLVWKKGDAIIVFGPNNTSAKFAYQGDGNKPTGVFTKVDGDTIKNITGAIYSTGNSKSDKLKSIQGTMNLMSMRIYNAGAENIVMSAGALENGELKFHHTMGLLELDITNLMELREFTDGRMTIRVSSDRLMSSTTAKLVNVPAAGDAANSEFNPANATIEFFGSGAKNYVDAFIKQNESLPAGGVKIYCALPLGVHESLKVELKENANGEPVAIRTIKPKEGKKIEIEKLIYPMKLDLNPVPPTEVSVAVKSSTKFVPFAFEWNMDKKESFSSDVKGEMGWYQRYGENVHSTAEIAKVEKESAIHFKANPGAKGAFENNTIFYKLKRKFYANQQYKLVFTAKTNLTSGKDKISVAISADGDDKFFQTVGFTTNTVEVTGEFKEYSVPFNFEKVVKSPNIVSLNVPTVQGSTFADLDKGVNLIFTHNAIMSEAASAPAGDVLIKDIKLVKIK